MGRRIHQLECGGGTMCPHLLDHPKTLWKTHFFDFLKVYNELGKVTRFGTHRPLFHGEMNEWMNERLIGLRFIQMYIMLVGVSGMDITAIAATMDDEADCELGDTDVGADFGDFGF